MGWVEIIGGIIVIIGAVLFFMPGKEKIGSILTITFSIIGAITLGGFGVMLTLLGILGGTFGLAKQLSISFMN